MPKAKSGLLDPRHPLQRLRAAVGKLQNHGLPQDVLSEFEAALADLENALWHRRGGRQKGVRQKVSEWKMAVIRELLAVRKRGDGFARVVGWELDLSHQTVYSVIDQIRKEVSPGHSTGPTLSSFENKLLSMPAQELHRLLNQEILRTYDGMDVYIGHKPLESRLKDESLTLLGNEGSLDRYLLIFGFRKEFKRRHIERESDFSKDLDVGL